MKVIVISRSEWADSNSTGHTLSSFFGSFPTEDLANLYFRSAPPSNHVCKTYVAITELSVLDGRCHIFQAEEKLDGNFIQEKTLACDSNKKLPKVLSIFERKLVNIFRGSKLSGVYVLQDFFWRINWWKSKKFNDFLDEFSPEVIFFPSFGDPYTHRVARYVASYCQARLVVFHADDHIFKSSKNQGWFGRFYLSIVKNEIKKTVELSALNFAISRSMRDKYSEYFGVEFDLLKKGYEFEQSEKYPLNVEEKLHRFRNASAINCVYIGSLEYGRWKSLALVAAAMGLFACKGINFSLSIYSQYQPSNKVLAEIEIAGVSKFYGTLQQDEIKDVIKESHLVIHVESFDESDMELTRHSFSTKIVDCLASGTPLFAVGPEEIASMDYLLENNLATCVCDETEVRSGLDTISDHYELVILKAKKAREFAFDQFNMEKIQRNLFSKLSKII